ncbi:MAG: DUF5668 domain-containing protein [Acidimicrobiia bacterium]|nr:DUF5668 domain-containing protein [Acidimicrobiia bacterium]
MNKEQRRAVVFGVLFVVVGLLFLLEALEVFEIAPATLWPLLLVAIGIGVLAGTGSDDEQGPIR